MVSLIINAYCTSLRPPPATFPHQLNAQRDVSDPELGNHLAGFAGFVMKDGREMTQTRYAVLRHIERVQHHYSFTIDREQLGQLVQWATEANAILFLPNSDISDPTGRVLVSAADGSAAEEAQVPYPADARARKQHHDSWLASKQIPVASSLPPILGASEARLRDAVDAARRMMALTLVAVRAESLTSDSPIDPAEMQQRFPEVFDELTPHERDFMANPQPSEQGIVNHIWKYEAVDTLRWSLNRSDTLDFPNQICDVPATAADLMRNGHDAIVAAAELRPATAILDQADLHLRLHWAVRQSGIDNTDPPQQLDGSVLQERRHALNWLLRFEDAAWDDVQTPT